MTGVMFVMIVVNALLYYKITDKENVIVIRMVWNRSSLVLKALSSEQVIEYHMILWTKPLKILEVADIRRWVIKYRLHSRVP